MAQTVRKSSKRFIRLNAPPPGSADFFAIDAYMSQFISTPPNGLNACITNIQDPLWPSCANTVNYDSNAGWPVGPAADPGSQWLAATPGTLRYALSAIQQRWPTKKMVRGRMTGHEVVVR